MRTLAKALAILDVFSQAAPSWRLSEIAEETGLDRSTAHRMLKTMVEFGYLSHRRETKRYELGATILRLALTREAAVATSEYYREILTDLTAATRESSHVSLLAGHQLATIASCQGLRNTRVVVEAGERLDLHATASGLACLAFGPSEGLERALAAPLALYGPRTPATPEALTERIERARHCGYAVADGTFDSEVFGIAAPIFGYEERAVGAVAVATPISRITPDLQTAIARATVSAALRASAVEAGRVPSSYLLATRKLLA